MFETLISHPTFTFLATIAIIGGLASLTRTLYEACHPTLCECFAASMFGAFVSLGLISIYVGNIDHVSAGDLKCIGLASLIGLAGKEQKQIIDLTWKSFMSKFTNNISMEAPNDKKSS